MVRCSNTLITILNSLTLALSLLLIGHSLWLTIHHDTLCQRVIQKPLLYLGLALFVVSLLGIIGSCCGVSFLLTLYLIVMFALILGLIAFTLFTLLVTNKGVGKSLSGRGYKEHKLGDYSNWLKKYVVNGNNWDKIKSCLVDVSVCSGYTNATTGSTNHPLAELQSGCCEPPAYCKMELVNGSMWVAPKEGLPAEADSDCSSWSNDQKQLCLDCNSCKAGVLHNIKRKWKVVAITNACITLLVIIIYSLGCCALENNREDRKYFTRLPKVATA